MAKAQTKKAPVAEVEEGDIQVGDSVIFAGYPADTPEADMVLAEGGEYTVVGLPGVDEEGQETGYILQVPNSKFNPKKKANPETNPEFFEAEVYAEEITLAEGGESEPEGLPEAEEEDAAEDDAITHEEVQGLKKAELLALAKENNVTLTPAQKKTEQTLRDALCVAFGLEPALEGELVDEGDEGAEEPITLEELNGYSKEELLALAAANEIALKPAQKKNETTLVAALAEAFGLEEEQAEEEPEPEAPAKPAKAAAKATAKTTAPAKAAAPAKAKAPAKVADTSEDELSDLPDLEGEDESVLALVAESEDLIATAQELESEVATNEYRLGGLLYHIKKEGTWADLNEEYKKPGGWALFVKEHFNVEYRKSQYLIQIYVNFTQAGIENPSEVVGTIGWTKAQKICPFILLEGEAPETWIEAAQANTVGDLSAIIKESVDAGDGTPGTAGTRLTAVTLKFRYMEEDAGIIEDILAVAKSTLGVDEKEALLHICKDWAISNNVETVENAKAASKVTKVAASAPAKPAVKAPAKPAAAAKAPVKPAAKVTPAKPATTARKPVAAKAK